MGYDIKEKLIDFEKNLRSILDDHYYESLNGTNNETIRELAIQEIILLHSTYENMLLKSIHGKLA